MSGCHNPYTKEEFHLVRGLIKRVESLHESREKHMKMMKELMNKISYLEEEIETLKINNQILNETQKEVKNPFGDYCYYCGGTGKLKINSVIMFDEEYKPKNVYTNCDKCDGTGKEKL